MWGGNTAEGHKGGGEGDEGVQRRETRGALGGSGPDDDGGLALAQLLGSYTHSRGYVPRDDAARSSPSLTRSV